MDSSRVEKSLGSYFEPRKTLWIARLLNTWISNEYGRPPVKTRFDDLIVPSIPSDSILVAPDEQIIYLYNISESLSPERQSNTEEYEAGIVKLATLNTQRSHDAVLLSRTIMALAFYRRLRSSETAGLKRQIFTHLGEIGIDGLQAAKRLARQQKPWWHLANVPFQLLCAMLVIGTASSFAYIPTALQALEEVEHEMPSSTITEALNISRRLIKLSRLEMTKQMQYLDQCSGASLVNHQTQAKDTQSEPPASELPIPWQMSGPEMQSDPSDFDWSFMPDMDIPLFDLDLYSA
ncbi:hypothetical protein KC330_g9135 [Hortaea werneckii]|nr:hypothetical protein KC330_g9135 [Hortaea werneckii]